LSGINAAYTKENKMGWGRTLLLGDIGNRLDIADTERDLKTLRSRLRAKGGVDTDQNKRIEQLQRDNGQLQLYLASLIRLLVAKGVLSQAEIDSFVEVIDDESGDENETSLPAT
jgi:hypothetical protein